MTNTEHVIAAVEAAMEMAPLKSLVNCAGIGWAARTIGRDGDYASAHDLDQYRRVIEINLIGTYNCIRLAATKMSLNNPDADGARGAIVNTASAAAEDGQIGQAAYSSSKGGMVGMTLPVARDLAVVGIRINTILPGLIDTPIYGAFEESEAFKAKLAKDVLFPNRLGHAGRVRLTGRRVAGQLLHERGDRSVSMPASACSPNSVGPKGDRMIDPELPGFLEVLPQSSTSRTPWRAPGRAESVVAVCDPTSRGSNAWR